MDPFSSDVDLTSELHSTTATLHTSVRQQPSLTVERQLARSFIDSQDSTTTEGPPVASTAVGLISSDVALNSGLRTATITLTTQTGSTADAHCQNPFRSPRACNLASLARRSEVDPASDLRPATITPRAQANLDEGERYISTPRLARLQKGQ